MGNIIIKINGLGKCYRIGAKQEQNRTFREVIMDIVKAPVRNLIHLRKLTEFDDSEIGKTNDIIWALRDVSFEVKEGEVVGIIGRNGAGKSTLLKILSRITEPTKGYAEIGGKISSLLEVGTGFHPELTGRENIYLNGTILGMRKSEIDREFDKIVAFSEIEKFIDTPVKHYSSGMYVRLAFAVAAHLDPEILVIDEVLAVGDTAFQKKCLGTMKDLQYSGRTVLFVSHNMAAIENLCKHTVWLDEGKIVEIGPTSEVISKYLSILPSDNPNVNLDNHKDRFGSGEVRIVQVSFLDSNNQSCSFVRMGDRLSVRLTVRSNCYKKNTILGVYLYTERGLLVSTLMTAYKDFYPDITTGTTCFDLVIEKVLLFPGTYMISPWITDSRRKDIDYVNYAAKFKVEPSDLLRNGVKFEEESRSVTHIPSYWEKVS